MKNKFVKVYNKASKNESNEQSFLVWPQGSQKNWLTFIVP